MKKAKTVFKNKLFFNLLIGFIIILLVYNIFISIKGSNVYGLVPILIEITLLILIFEKNRYTKLAIYVWASVTLIIGFGFEAIADLMDDFNNNFETFKIDSYAYNVLGLIIGIFVIYCTRKTVAVNLYENDSRKVEEE